MDDATAVITPTRKVGLKFLYLDLTTCDRCIGTDSSLSQAVALLSPVLREIGVEIDFRKTLVESKDKALELGFASSPTVRVNGYDIAGELRESRCAPCGDTCGCEDGVDCRVWEYNGKEYDQAPVGLIVDAVLAAAYGRPRGLRPGHQEHLNENLERYFVSKSPNEARICCDAPALCCGSDPR